MSQHIDLGAPAGTFAWVAQAVSSDQSRPVLAGVEISEDGHRMTATDGHRIHSALLGSSGFRDGLINPRSFEPILRDYPNWRGVTDKMVDAECALQCGTGGDLFPVLEAAAILHRKMGGGSFGLRFPVWIETANGRAAFNPRFLLEALRGLCGTRQLDHPAFLCVNPAQQRNPILCTDLTGRFAVIMPVRMPEDWRPESLFRLNRYLAQNV